MRFRRYLVVAASMVVLQLFAVVSWPEVTLERAFSVEPDSREYIQGAASLLRGAYTADAGEGPYVPRYPPGFSLLLAPAVALGGPAATVWAVWGFAILLLGVAAWLAWKVAGAAAVPLTLLFAGITPALAEYASLVMSDAPSTALLLVAAALLVSGNQRALVAAGVLAGFLGCVRYANAPLILAGLAPLIGHPHWWKRAAVYLAAASVPLVLLLVWQFLSFGSPLMDSYRAAGIHRLEITAGGLYSWHYMLAAPAGIDPPPYSGGAYFWRSPNLVAYTRLLAGEDGFLLLPGVGLVGLVGLVRLALRPGVPGSIGRFGLISSFLTLAMYLPYFYQSARFILTPAVFLSIGAGSLLVEAFAARRAIRYLTASAGK